MIAQSFSRLARFFGAVALVVCLFATCAKAQQTLGSLNGTILDTSGAAIPGATVTVSDSEIGVTRTVQAHSTGSFQVYNLPVGHYKIEATHAGFQTTDLSGVTVQEAQATTVKVVLNVGEAETTVNVSANPMLNATDPTNGYTLSAKQIQMTPLATGSFTQLAVLTPGVSAELLSGLDSNAGLGNQPIWANGQRDTSNTFQVNGVDVTNLFNGKSSSGSNSQRYNFNIGGGTTSTSGSSAGSAAIGGANPVGTSVYGSNGNSLPSPPPEFLQEIRVNTSMYDAEQGATSGAQIDASTVSGTNQFHGQVYGTLASNDTNADPFFFKQQALLTSQQNVGAFPMSLANPYLDRWTTGATIGGPIKKDKLFFFLAYQFTYSSDQSTGLSQMNVPAGLTDDRSTAGLDAAAASGGFAAPGAIAPQAFDLLNAKLPNGQYLIPSTLLPTTTPFAIGVPNVTLIGNSIFASHQATASLDYQATTNDRVAFKYYYQTDPVTRPYGVAQTGGFPVTDENGAQTAELDNTILIGSKFNWEQRLGYVRELSYSYNAQTLGPDSVAGSAFAGQPNYGIGTGEYGVNNAVLPGLLLKEFAYNSTDSPGLKVGPYSNFMNLGFYQNKLNPSTNIIWTLGKHTILAGGGYSYTQLNVEDQRNGLETVATKNFDTFLQGTVQSSAILYSVANGHNNANRYYRANENDWYVQDKWQALPNLSITAGVRWDYHGGMTEKYGNMFNFDPSAYDVTGTVASGFNVVNSGFVIAGNNPNATPGTTDSTLTGRQWGLSPRLGFAYSPKRDDGKLVISGGGGIYYDRGELFTYLSQPAGNGSGGPFGVTESAPLANYVPGQTGPGYTKLTLAQPLGIAANQSNLPTGKADFIKQQLQTVLGTGPGQTSGYSGANSPQFGQNCSGIDNQEDYTDCPDALNFGAYDKNNVLPYTINYTLKVQWQPRQDMAVLLGYVGNRGRHAVIPIPFNEPGLATPTNPIHGETGTYGFEVLNQNNFVGYDYAPITGEPWNSEDGGNTDFRAPYIGYSPNAALFETVGNSAYDALQAQVVKRMSHHLQATANYTWSHSLDEQSDIGLFFTGDNPNKLRDSYASSDFDRTHVFTLDFLATLPDFAPKYSVLSYLTNGWSATGIGIVQSGEPYSLYEFYGAVGSAYFGDYPTLLNPVLPIKNPGDVKAALTGNSGRFRGAGGNYIPYINPNDIAINYLQPGQKGVPVSTGTDPQDVYETDFVPGQRNLFKQALQKRLDFSVRKDFEISSRYSVRFDFNVFNIFNTTSEDVPQNETAIRQSSACSASAIKAANGASGTADDGNCSNKDYYVNYGQIVTSNSSTDQQSALTNLDQKPITTGTGSGTVIPLTLQPGQGSCTTTSAIGGVCPNNGANFGSVTGTIGGSRAITMGLHFLF